MDLTFPFAEPPAPGTVTTVAPGLLWARLALPFRLDHVNVYFLEGDDGWTIVDTGISNKATVAAWEALLAGPFRGARFAGLIVTHHHPDHIGMAGWLCERLEIPLLMSRTAYLACLTLFNSPELLAASAYTRFYVRHGMAEDLAALVSTMGHDYMRMLSKPPFTFERLRAGDRLTLGGRSYAVMSGEGHGPEQLMFHAAADGLFLAADQVIEKISPNVSVTALEPHGDPLGDFIASQREIAATIPDDTLVLAGHRLPFYGAAARATALAAHHEERCARIADAADERPVSAADLIPVLFDRALSPHETSFAFSEILAHLNYMAGRGDIAWETEGDRMRVRRA
ncbi:MBL fold metallo-hydrolase [Acuticoccus sp. I52.16.1]|uniref:MBL fold metallo-hydrolase n=1 Tax=Acuticoccus sp. I52.16.1 TaxID=2928472 RepID=UPI001FD512B5|nr:MBL fold metallo-hydrolase [Acuticoccus sp. I52.16.1]UOM33136.1 MBL fold metallo-hydrolase [Acuticoccus sp. I52.16.1]